MRILVIGAGAQAKYALETFALRDEHEVVAVLDEKAEAPASWPDAYGCRCLGGFAHLEDLASREADAFLVCWSQARRKRELFERALALGLQAASAIHPRAQIARTAAVGPGSIVNAGAVVQPFARVGRAAMIHANVVIEHDCQLGDYVNLAPGARLAGWVRVGDGSTVFTGANVAPGVKIGDRARVAAGATVLEDVPDDALAAGVPAVVERRSGAGEADA